MCDTLPVRQGQMGAGDEGGSVEFSKTPDKIHVGESLDEITRIHNHRNWAGRASGASSKERAGRSIGGFVGFLFQLFKFRPDEIALFIVGVSFSQSAPFLSSPRPT